MTTQKLVMSLLFATTAFGAMAQTKPKPPESRTIIENIDKAFGVQPDGRELAEREFRICMVDAATRLLSNKIDAAPLIATVASEICSGHLYSIFSFEAERRKESDARSIAEQVRSGMVKEMTTFIVKRRAGMIP